MAKGYNQNRRKAGQKFTRTFIYQSKSVPWYRGGRRVF